MTMKVFSPSVPHTQPRDLWNVVGLEEHREGANKFLI